MKNLYFIIALYVLLLSVRPCCVEDNCTDEDHSTKTEQTTGHNRGDEYNSNCSPFLSCGNCIGFNYTTVSYPLLKPATFESSQLQSYETTFPTGFYFLIWQPPKVS